MKPSLPLSVLTALLLLLCLAAILAACKDKSADTTSGSATVPPTLQGSTLASTHGTATNSPATTVTPSITAPLPLPDTTPDIPGSDTVPDNSSGAVPETTTPAPVTTTAPPATTQPPTTTTPPVTEAPQNPWVVDCNEYITLRKSGYGSAITTISNGQTVDLLKFSGPFAKVRWRGYEGWVQASYLTLPEGKGSSSDLSVVVPVENYSYEQMQADLATLAARYPDLLTLSSIGKSEEGRDLTLCILGNPNAKKKIFLQSAIHGREHVVALLTLCEIDYILSHPEMEVEDGVTVADLLSQIVFHIVPMSNPDGVTISQTGVLPEAFRNRYPDPTEIARIWKANAKGIDLNANFDADWEDYRSIYETDVPDYMGYKGEAPECAAESKALADYLRQNRFDLTLSYHTSGSLIYWAYDAETLPELNAKNLELANLLAGYSGFLIGEQESTSTAGLKDWAIQSLLTPSLTIEFAAADSPAPFREFEQTWARGKYTLLTCAQWVLEQEGSEEDAPNQDPDVQPDETTDLPPVDTSDLPPVDTSDLPPVETSDLPSVETSEATTNEAPDEGQTDATDSGQEDSA